MARWPVPAALLVALLGATGCVAARVREIPHADREALGSRDGGLVVAAGGVRGAALTATLHRATITRYRETRRVERLAEFAYLSAAEGVWDSVDHPAAKVAVLPLALVGAVIDVAAWVCSAPFAYPAGAIGAIDDAPVTEEVEGLDAAPLPGGTPVTVAAAGVAAAPLTVTTDAAGRITADLDAIATAALEAGRETAIVELRAGGGASAAVSLGLAQLCDAVAVRIERDRELREWRWRKLLEACPPAATAVRAALQARLDAGP
jgi:hypothetical protein